MVTPTATARDDDPVHPNYDGIRFQVTTDRRGIIAVPTSAMTMPPVSYLPAAIAAGVSINLANLIEHVKAGDPQSYFATFLEDILEDLKDAVSACAREDQPS